MGSKEWSGCGESGENEDALFYVGRIGPNDTEKEEAARKDDPDAPC
jgi:hypothetical protein